MKTSGIIKTASEKLSFLDLAAKNDRIVIPLIQRDYAQGRTSEKAKKIRQDFVEELHARIIGHTPLSLDFVYGTRENGKFIPLDGQQRLTTLFLLHIYLEGVAFSRTSAEGMRRPETSYKFSYETRDSSRRFCDAVTEHRIEIFNDKELTGGIYSDTGGTEKRQTPSMIIKNQSWWFGVWESDPTVSGMLHMLDEIHRVFFVDAVQAYKILFAPGSPAVTFQFMPLEKFYDPDDLYMKMNARGLPLTPFEIFKSRFYGVVETLFPKQRVREIKSRIDVAYTDFLWPLRHKGMKNIDIYFQRIFKLLIANEHICLSKASDKEWLDYLFEANKKQYPFAYNQFLKMGVSFDEVFTTRILDDLDLLCSDKSIWTATRLNPGQADEWIEIGGLWNGLIVAEDTPDATYRRRLELQAVIRFFATFPAEFATSELPVWTRLIRNLLESSPIDNSNRMATALRNIDTLIESLRTAGQGVNDWVASAPGLKNAFFSEAQWQEEAVKARLRKDPLWDEQILRAERHPYLKGEIAFALWISKVIPVRTPLSVDVGSADLDLFTRYLDKILPLMDEIGNADNVSVKEHRMVRAMLGKGDYMPWSSSGRKNLYNRPGDRDYSWKALFRIDGRTRTDALDCLKQILDDADFDPEDVAGSLDRIGSRRLPPETTPLWIRLLTSRLGNRILAHSHQGFIAFAGDREDYNDRNVLIYGSSQRNGFHSELCSLYLFSALKEKHLHPTYNWVLGKESDYGLTFKDSRGEDVTICCWNGVWYTKTEALKEEFHDINTLRKFIASRTGR